MDWFNNIGCEELENEAVTYFEQYIGSISEVLASNSNEQNVSDKGDSDIENDESDIDNTCDRIQSARTERGYYKFCTQRARDELKLAESPIGKYNTPCSTNFENVHYTFDFSQYVNLPHLSQQVGALYFLTPRKVQIFGVNTVSQLVKFVDNSAKCNRSEVYNENDDDENSLKGIGKFHHFRLTGDEVGVVFARETLDQPEKRLVLLKESANLPELLTTLPEVIQPAGLTEERRSYLYNEVRPFVQFNFCDEFCPRASEE
ncbi:unnamed protein product [Mytilus coruscus]|uniref:Uncharacterized protein n=1 Tax=Mytilus coruscus TaxID=42192 RepID=A0A6J8E5G4_MYTCO|nr:unnamed protein product [Mytilus coruscus]